MYIFNKNIHSHTTAFLFAPIFLYAVSYFYLLVINLSVLRSELCDLLVQQKAIRKLWSTMESLLLPWFEGIKENNDRYVCIKQALHCLKALKEELVENGNIVEEEHSMVLKIIFKRNHAILHEERDEKTIICRSTCVFHCLI